MPGTITARSGIANGPFWRSRHRTVLSSTTNELSCATCLSLSLLHGRLGVRFPISRDCAGHLQFRAPESKATEKDPWALDLHQEQYRGSGAYKVTSWKPGSKWSTSAMTTGWAASCPSSRK